MLMNRYLSSDYASLKEKIIMKKLILIICLLLVAVMIMNARDQSAKTSAAEWLSTAIEKHGLDIALKMFAKLRENPGSYDFNTQEFNALGDKLLDGRKYESAVAVFRLNVDMFPESWSIYFRLARACMYTGDWECAERNFHRVLKKNPNFCLSEFILADLDSRLERVARERKFSYQSGQQTGLKGPYLGQKPPVLSPNMFAPGIVSKALALNFNCTFSPDGKYIFYHVGGDI